MRTDRNYEIPAIASAIEWKSSYNLARFEAPPLLSPRSFGSIIGIVGRRRVIFIFKFPPRVFRAVAPSSGRTLIALLPHRRFDFRLTAVGTLLLAERQQTEPSTPADRSRSFSILQSFARQLYRTAAICCSGNWPRIVARSCQPMLANERFALLAGLIRSLAIYMVLKVGDRAGVPREMARFARSCPT